MSNTMTNIEQTVEAALTNAESHIAQEATSLEAAAVATTHTIATDITKEAKAIETACQHAYAYVCTRCHQAKTNTLTEAEEDARVIEGAFMRTVRRVVEFI